VGCSPRAPGSTASRLALPVGLSPLQQLQCGTEMTPMIPTPQEEIPRRPSLEARPPSVSISSEFPRRPSVGVASEASPREGVCPSGTLSGNPSLFLPASLKPRRRLSVVSVDSKMMPVAEAEKKQASVIRGQYSKSDLEVDKRVDDDDDDVPVRSGSQASMQSVVAKGEAQWTQKVQQCNRKESVRGSAFQVNDSAAFIQSHQKTGGKNYHRKSVFANLFDIRASVPAEDEEQILERAASLPPATIEYESDGRSRLRRRVRCLNRNRRSSILQ
ncbi:unnamed protein product, partial [Polarella glacialis]